MITGKITSRTASDGQVYLEPFIPVIVLGEKSGVSKELQVAVDTGFNGWLALPNETIEELGLDFLGARPSVQADGQERNFNIFRGVVLWHGEEKRILVLEKGGTPLLGTSLLEQSNLTIDVIAHGDVTISQLP
jgi:clan AA aspartic protease